MAKPKHALKYSNFQPGCLSTLCALQSEYYARVWEFDHLYESAVANGVAEFLQRYQPENDFIRLALMGDKICGGIAIDSHDGQEGQLRWFIVNEQLRGLGVGKRLIIEAMEFVKKKSFIKIYLTTFAGLDSARRLYELSGFNMVDERVASTWGKAVTEQRFEWHREK